MPTIKEDIAYFEDLAKRKKLCKCGHSVAFTTKSDRLICHWCGKWVYRTDQIEFKYKMMSKLNKEVKK